MFLVLLLAVSVSIDTWGIGIAYGVAHIRIPLKSRILIAIVNGMLTGIAMLLTYVCIGDRGGTLITVLGGVILILLGIRSIRNACRGDEMTDFDKDSSHSIDLREGATLGVAMAADSVCATLSLRGMGDVTIAFPICTALLGAFFMWLGGRCSYRLPCLTGIGGGVLVSLGLIRMISGVLSVL